MSDLQIIAAILVPAAVATISVLSAHRLSQRTLEHQRRLSDIYGARALLDQGAELLRQSTELVLALSEGFAQFGHQMFGVPVMPETYDALDRIADDLGALSMKVDIRLGPSHPAGRSLDLICGAVDQMRRVLRMARLGNAPTAERSAEDRRDIAKATRRYFDQTACYIVSAHSTVGAELPGVDLTMLSELRFSSRPSMLRLLQRELMDRLPLPAVVVRRIERSNAAEPASLEAGAGVRTSLS